MRTGSAMWTKLILVVLLGLTGLAHAWYNSVFTAPKHKQRYQSSPQRAYYPQQQSSYHQQQQREQAYQRQKQQQEQQYYQQQQQQQQQYQQQQQQHYQQQPQQPAVVEACGECDQSKCAKNLNCPAGHVRDRCGCCLVCGLGESHLCNLESEAPAYMKRHVGKPWYGRCGQNLECRVRDDVDTRLTGGPQSICFCLEPGLVCGSDGQTYSQCQLRAQITATGGQLRKMGDGPCKQKPMAQLNSPTQAIRLDDKVTLVCEVRGYPRADVTWHMVKPGDGKSRRMPSNSADVTVSLRGGESETQVVSYLQITNFTLDHEGEYHCLAENELGMDDKSAHVVLRT